MKKKIIIISLVAILLIGAGILCLAILGGEEEHTHRVGATVEEGRVEPGCVLPGRADRVTYCLDCGEELTRYNKTIPSLGHSFVDGFCTVCASAEPSESLSLKFNNETDDYTVTSIGSCTDEHIIIPNEWQGYPVTSIDDGAFDGLDFIKSVTVSEGIVSIGNRAFYSCSSLSSVSLPESLRIIENEAFSECEELYDISIPTGIESFGSDVFKNCTSLEFFESSGAYYFGNEANPFVVLVKIKDKNTASLEINSETKFIYSEAFRESSIKEITIPSGVREIGNASFFDCQALTRVTISDGVLTVGPSAFENCKELVTVSFGSGISSVGARSFCGCVSLSTVILPDSVTKIGSSAFSNCTALANVNLGDGIVSIGSAAFSLCTSLRSIVLPKSVRDLGSSLFSGCLNFADIYYKGTEEQWAKVKPGSYNNDIFQNANKHFEYLGG